VSLTWIITAYYGHTKALSWMMIGCSVMCITDGFVTKDKIGREQWNH
jgi:hypothetical protein